MVASDHPDPAAVLAQVRRFVDDDVRPRAPALEHADEYPHDLVARMRGLGLFGALVPAAYGGLGLDVTTYARVIEELCRGWMSLAGVINSHTMAALIVLHHGTEEQRRRLLPRFAAGDARGGLCLTEAHAGSDVQAIRTVARRRGDVYVVDGAKMFVTNGREGNTFALLAVTDAGVAPRHRGMSCFIVEKGHPGLRVVKSIGKLGYKGVDTAELLFDAYEVPAANLVGGVEGRGFKHVMSGLEAGRINIAARAVGVAQAVFDDTVAGLRRASAAEAPALADMAAKLAAARSLTYWAAGMKDREERCDLEAGMAKLYASETAQDLAATSLRLAGPTSALASSPLERYYRDTPLMIIGEGTNEIQRLLVARSLLERHGERAGPLAAHPDEPEDRRHMILAVRQFVEKDVVPVAAAHDGAGEIPAAVLRTLAELGVLGAAASPEQGGLGLDEATVALLVEELARGWASLATVVATHLAVTRVLASHGSRAQRERWLPALARGEHLGAVALDAAVAARQAGDGPALAGAARLVAGAAHAGVFLVVAGDPPVAVLLPRATPGLGLGAAEATLGQRAAGTAAVTFDDARAGRDAVVAPGAAAARTALAAANLGVAATGVGVAQAAFEAALRYSQQRTAFGKPICQHQAIQLKLADMATAITAGRALVRHAAGPATDGPDDGDAAALARLHAAEMAGTVTLEAMRIHGGYGYTTEFPVERYYRDAAHLLHAPLPLDRSRHDLGRRLVSARG
jgi:alkylation response protein AidB-like acyl-CoA dehydrogenase